MMTRQTLNEMFKREVLGLLDETFAHTHGFFLDRGNSLMETVEEIPASAASRPVSSGGASIAGQVEHICYYLTVLESELRGRKLVKVDWNESWQVKEVTPEGWETLKRRLRQTCERVMSTIRGVEDWETGNDVGAPMAILAHTAYHLGAIRQMLSKIG